MSPIEIIHSLGLELPAPAAPGGNYVPVNIRGNIAYISIQFPKRGSEVLYRGRLGVDFDTEEGYKASQLCALNVLAQVQQFIGFDRLVGLNHMDAYYLGSAGWDESPKVINGASDLFVKVLGEKGLHTRAIFGVEYLPKNFVVGVTCSFTLM